MYQWVPVQLHTKTEIFGFYRGRLCGEPVHSQSFLRLSAKSLWVLGLCRLVLAVCLPHLIQCVAQVVQLASPKFAASSWRLPTGPKLCHHAVVDRGEKIERKLRFIFVHKKKYWFRFSREHAQQKFLKYFLSQLKSSTCASLYPGPEVCLRMGQEGSCVP